MKLLENYRKLNKRDKVNISLISGNIAMWIDNLVRLTFYILDINLRLNNILSVVLIIGGFSLLFYSWRYLFGANSLSNLKFYRKYIKRNKVWIREYYTKEDGISFFRWNIIDDAYFKNGENESNSLLVNIREVFNNHNSFEKDTILLIIESYRAMGSDFNDSINGRLTNLYIENHTNKNLIYTFDENIYLINSREKNINDILNQ